MKCVLVLSLVALCYAEVPLTPTAPSVSFGKDGTITITGADGKKVIISNSIGNSGQKNVDISVPDSLGTTRTIKVNQDYNVKTINIANPTTENQNEGARYKRSSIKSSKESKTGKSEAEILDGIFREYEGAVDLKSYEKVLKEIDSYIKSGDLDSSIFKVLKGFAQYEALNPEGSYFGQGTIGSEPGIGYSSRQAYLQNYLNRDNTEQQGLNSLWYGAKQPVSELYQGPIYTGANPFWYKGMNGGSLQEFRDFYGQQQKNQLSPVQDVQQYLQQKWQPSYVPYQQQPLQQLALPQQQLKLPLSLWSLQKQQEQEKLLWNQMLRQQLTETQQLTQPQQLQSQQVLTQPQEQLNFLLPKRQLIQELPWKQAQKLQQKYGPQQQFYVPQQQYYGPQQQYYGPQQQYYGSQQQEIESQGYQQGKQLENMVYPQSQLVPNQQLWTLSKQQLAQEQQGLPLSRDQQIQSNVPLGNYWQRLWAPQMRQVEYPVNLPVV